MAEVGTIWKSKSLALDDFFVLSAPEALCDERNFGQRVFVGNRAKRKDGKICLVDLTEKPKDYPYDWVEY